MGTLRAAFTAEEREEAFAKPRKARSSTARNRARRRRAKLHAGAPIRRAGIGERDAKLLRSIVVSLRAEKVPEPAIAASVRAARASLVGTSARKRQAVRRALQGRAA